MIESPVTVCDRETGERVAEIVGDFSDDGGWAWTVTVDSTKASRSFAVEPLDFSTSGALLKAMTWLEDRLDVPRETPNP